MLQLSPPATERAWAYAWRRLSLSQSLKLSGGMPLLQSKDPPSPVAKLQCFEMPVPVSPLCLDHPDGSYGNVIEDVVGRC